VSPLLVLLVLVVVVGAGAVPMVVAWLLEHTMTGARLDGFVQRWTEAGL
jgi:hypothetical protein